MKRITALLLTALLLLSLAACGGKDAWQEQYDLGMRYLNDGNYEEAIIAFTAAIEIDEKRPEGYEGRGRAYVLSGETAENLEAAKSDFEKALELDPTYVDAWLDLADIYIRQGDFDEAMRILEEALEATGQDQAILDKIKEMQEGRFNDSDGRPRKTCHYENGELIQYWLYEYDEKGNNVKTTCYNGDDTLHSTEISEYNDAGQETRMVATEADGYVRTEVYTYDSTGRRIRVDGRSEPDNDSWYVLITYDDTAMTETRIEYRADGTFEHRFVVEKDQDGVRRKASNYLMDENGNEYLDYYVEYIWNEDGTYGGFNLYQVAERND